MFTSRLPAKPALWAVASKILKTSDYFNRPVYLCTNLLQERLIHRTHQKIDHMKKAGILGGGQLGRMLLQAAANYPVETYVMENERQCPAAHLCHHFITGDIRNYDDVYRLGKMVDVLTIEIEQVNTDALQQLKREGVRIIPDPDCLEIIANKIKQKEFLKELKIPTAPFVVTQNLDGLYEHADMLPAVHKLAVGGYDGKGVVVIHHSDQLHQGFNAPSVLEQKVQIEKELALMVAVDQEGQTTVYPLVEMVFDQRLNLLSHQISPANVHPTTEWKAEAIAIACVKALNSPGVFAVEMFEDAAGQVLVNEIAPRVHNSGHHTIEGNYSSQFDMLCRILLGYPLGNTEPILPAALVNLVGADQHSGEPVYDGLGEVLKMENVFVHIYGKFQTRPGRKMGHVTVISSEPQELLHKVMQIQKVLSVKSAV